MANKFSAIKGRNFIIKARREFCKKELSVYKKPTKVAVIGLDCAITHLIEKHIAEGHLPTFRRLFEEGVLAKNCLTNYPTVTPPGWATLATGAWAGTHGITDFHVHEPGTQLDNSNIKEAFSSERLQAEFIWDAADRAGKKSIVLNYPGAWPRNMNNGVVIGGTGLSIGEYRDGLWLLQSRNTLCHDQLITTGIYPNSIRREFSEAGEWANVPEMGEGPLEMEVDLNFPDAKERPAPTTWYILVRETGDEGYDRVTLSRTRNFKHAFCTLCVGEWSQKIFTKIRMEDGSEQDVFFRVKLLELSDDADDFRLFIGNLCCTTGWTSPPELAEKISAFSREGTFASGGGLIGYPVGWFDLDTYVEINEQYTQFLADAAEVALKEGDWDIFYMHSHPPDWVYHAVMTDMDPETCQDEKKRKAAWKAHLEVYETQDRLIARLLRVMEDETLVVLVSDHGATPDGPIFDPYSALVPAGLCDNPKFDPTLDTGTGYTEEVLKKKAYRSLVFNPDPKKSKAIPQRAIYVYVNLKGRDPDGIVEPEDYKKVQQEIIDALYTYVDPDNGKRPVALALSKQDARILGLYGDRVGDVVYALYPWFGSQHAQILPTAEHGVGSLKGLFCLTGPGIRKGHRLERTVWLTDLVPTICYLMDLPLPAHTEGAVIYQALEDPDFKRKEVEELKNRLAEMEKRLG